MTPVQWVQLVVTIIGFAVVVAGAAVYIKSAVVKTNHEELQALADTRAERIDDLETAVERLGGELRSLKGQMEAIQSIKAQEIAFEVARILRPSTGDTL